MLKGKTILVISPQKWGEMRLSKHHYAIALAELGNKVYFLNPPNIPYQSKFSIIPIIEQENLFLVNYQTFFSTKIRFRLRYLYNFLMSFQVKWLLKQLGEPIDIIWCFEPNLYDNLKWFEGKVTIYHPVDEFDLRHQIQVGRYADYIISVTKEILSKYQHFKAQKIHIHHGISEAFKKEAIKNSFEFQKDKKIKIGYVGNVGRSDIDIQTFRNIILENPDVVFEFWGSYKSKQSNIDASPLNDAFINFLQQKENVILHGPVNSNILAKQIQNIDVFLICYDVLRDISKGTNYHKIMEYLSTGKVIVSNNVTTFSDSPDLIVMVKSRENNKELPKLFKEVVINLEEYNVKDKMQKRIDFALSHTYQNNVLLLERIIRKLQKNKK